MRTSLSSTRRGSAFPLLFGLVAAALATWLVPASVHVVAWEDGTPTRIGLVPSPLVLAALVGMAVLAFLLIRRVPVPRFHMVSCVCAPLMLLFLWALPYLPWLPDRFPLMLILAGPVRWLVLGFAVLGCLLSALTRVDVDALVALRWPRAKGVFAMSVVVFLLLGGYVKYHQGVGGDEPHYLVIAHSLLVDGDLQIENNHVAGDYRSFWGGPLPPYFIRRGVDDTIYSVHAAGLPALLVPFYGRLAGQWGAMALLERWRWVWWDS